MHEGQVHNDRFSWHDSLKANRSSDLSITNTSAASTSDERRRQERESSREVLGRSSIDARRRTPVTSSEYIRSASRLSFNTSVDPNSPITPHCSNIEILPQPFGVDKADLLSSHELSSGGAGIGNCSLGRRPSILGVEQSRLSRLPSTLEEPGTPAKRRVAVLQQHSQSRFSTSPASRHSKHARTGKKMYVPDGQVHRNPSREGFPFDLPRSRPRAGTVSGAGGDNHCEAASRGQTAKMSVRANAAIRGKSSLASLRKLMTRASAAPVLSLTKASRTPVAGEHGSYVNDRTQHAPVSSGQMHKTRVREPPMPLSIEVAPFEFCDAMPSVDCYGGTINMITQNQTPLDAGECLAEIRIPSRTSSTAHEDRPQTASLQVPRHLDARLDKRSTILVRGSWIEIGKSADEVSTAVNGGGNAKSWWSRLRGSAALASRQGNVKECVHSDSKDMLVSRAAKLRLATAGPTVSDNFCSQKFGLPQGTDSPLLAPSQTPRSSLSLKRAVSRGFSTLPSVGEERAKKCRQRPPLPPLLTLRGPSRTCTDGVQANEGNASSKTASSPLVQNDLSVIPLRPLQLSPTSSSLQPNSAPNVAFTDAQQRTAARGSSRISTRATRRSRSLPLPYLMSDGEEEGDERLTPQKTLSVLSPSRTQDEHTQRTVGSSILFLDEELNTGTDQAISRAEIRKPSSPASPLLSLSPLLSENVSVTRTSPASSKDTSVSTLEANDILFNLIRHFKSESSPSSLGSTVVTLRTDRANATATLSPNRARSPTCRRSKNTKRTTCTTLETIMTYQSSSDSELTSDSVVLNMWSGANSSSHLSTVSGAAMGQRSSTSLLEDLIEGIVEDVQQYSHSTTKSTMSSARSFQTRQRVCSRARRQSRTSSSVRGTSRSAAPSSKPSSSIDSAYSDFCWPPPDHPICKALFAATSPSAMTGTVSRQRGEKGDAGIRMLGADVVALELNSLAQREDSWCSPMRVRTASATSALSCPRSRLRSTPSDLDLTRLGAAVTVSRALVPDMMHVVSRLKAEYAAKKAASKRKVAMTASRPTARRVEERRSKSFSSYQCPPKIRIDRPQSDSTLSTTHGESLSEDEAIIHRASLIRKSTASVLDFSAIIASRTGLQASMPASRRRARVVRGKGSVASEGGASSESAARGTHMWPLLASNTTPSPARSSLPDVASPVSPMSASQQWSDVSGSFAWSDMGKRLSIGTTYTVPSPGMTSITAAEPASTKRRQRNWSNGRHKRRGGHVCAPATLHEEVRRSREHHKDSDYSRSIMEAFDPPITCKELCRLLDQSIAAFVPLEDGQTLKSLHTVDIVEGRFKPHRLRARRRLSCRPAAGDFSVSSASQSTTTVCLVAQQRSRRRFPSQSKTVDRNDDSNDSGTAEDYFVSCSPLNDELDESPLHMPSIMNVDHCDDDAFSSRYPNQSSPLRQRVTSPGAENSDNGSHPHPQTQRRHQWTAALQSPRRSPTVWRPQSTAATIPRLSAQMLASFNVSLRYGAAENDEEASMPSPSRANRRHTPQIVVQSPSTASSETRSPR